MQLVQFIKIISRYILYCNHSSKPSPYAYVHTFTPAKNKSDLNYAKWLLIDIATRVHRAYNLICFYNLHNNEWICRLIIVHLQIYISRFDLINLCTVMHTNPVFMYMYMHACTLTCERLILTKLISGVAWGRDNELMKSHT